MTTSYRILKRTEVDIVGLGRLLAHSYDPVGSIREHTRGLADAARARQHSLGDVTSQALRFALETLLPARERTITAHLKETAINQTALEGFLTHSLELAGGALEASEDADDVADAVASALDDLHSYVVAHRLVADGYLAAERALAERMLHADDADRAASVTNGRHTHARDRELALVA